MHERIPHDVVCHTLQNAGASPRVSVSDPDVQSFKERSEIGCRRVIAWCSRGWWRSPS